MAVDAFYQPVGPMRHPSSPEPPETDPFFASSSDLQSAFKKTSKKTEAGIATDRAQFMDMLGSEEEDEALTERDLSLAGGQMRRGADANANEQVAAISRRMGGDTSSAQFNLLASGVRGGAAASTGAAMARFRLESAEGQKSRALDRARLLLGLQSTELSRRSFDLQQQGFLRNIFESDRTYENTLEQQQSQLKMFALQNPDPFGRQFGGAMGGVQSAYNFLG